MRPQHALFTVRRSVTALLGAVLIAAAGSVVHDTKPLRTLPPAVQLSAPGENPRTSELSSRPISDFDVCWREQVELPASAARDRSLAVLLGEYALTAPERAVSLALAEFDPALRQTLLSAVLCSWASVAPDAAANWSLQRPFSERGIDIAAVFAGAAHDARTVLSLANRIVRDDPALAHDHGCSLVLVLTERGAFSEAAHFAGLGSAEHREAWLSTAYGIWAEHEPVSAAKAALALNNDSDRGLAAHTVIARWSLLDPHALADFALGLQPGAIRQFAFSSALVRWADQNVAAASAWIDALEPNLEIDAGVAAVASQPSLIAVQPEIAASWAESILDADLRVRTLALIVQEWRKIDPVSARTYVETSSAIADDRTRILASLTEPSDG